MSVEITFLCGHKMKLDKWPDHDPLDERFPPLPKSKPWTGLKCPAHGEPALLAVETIEPRKPVVPEADAAYGQTLSAFAAQVRKLHTDAQAITTQLADLHRTVGIICRDLLEKRAQRATLPHGDETKS